MRNKEIISAINRVIKSQVFIGGEEVVNFEKEIARFSKAKYAVSVNSGTDALFLCLKALGIKEGDEVITTPFTFIATAEVIANLGAIPVFVDIDPVSFNINPDLILKSITSKTKAIIPVHLFGKMAEMGKIMEIAKKHNLFVIEDSAQAIGVKYTGNAACLSFFPSKNLGGIGDGGMIITNNKKLAEDLKLLRNHGSSPKDKYVNLVLGTNSRLDAIQAAVLRIKLKELKSTNKKRRDAGRYYNKLLKDIVITPEINDEDVLNQYTIRVKNRDKLKKYLLSKEIQARIYYPLPLHLQPAFKYLDYKSGDFVESEKASREVISLPISENISRKEQDRIVKEIKKFI